MSDLKHTLTLDIPLQTARQVDILIKSMVPDPVINVGQFSVEYEPKQTSTSNNYVQITFQSIDERIMRVGVNNTIEAIKSIIETFDEFDSVPQV